MSGTAAVLLMGVEGGANKSRRGWYEYDGEVQNRVY
jgi:hypothetical protein